MFIMCPESVGYSSNFRYFSDRLRKIFLPAISRIAFFANHENIFIGGLTDEAENIITLAMKRIIKAMWNRIVPSNISSFLMNFEAKNCTWQTIN